MIGLLLLLLCQSFFDMQNKNIATPFAPFSSPPSFVVEVFEVVVVVVAKVVLVPAAARIVESRPSFKGELLVVVSRISHIKYYF